MPFRTALVLISAALFSFSACLNQPHPGMEFVHHQDHYDSLMVGKWYLDIVCDFPELGYECEESAAIDRDEVWTLTTGRRFEKTDGDWLIGDDYYTVQVDCWIEDVKYNAVLLIGDPTRFQNTAYRIIEENRNSIWLEWIRGENLGTLHLSRIRPPGPPPIYCPGIPPPPNHKPSHAKREHNGSTTF